MRSNKVLFIVLILAVCLTQFAADIYAPALPAIADYFGTSINNAQWSMAIYMLGVALSQLVYGPVSEGYGRKIPLIIGLGIMLFGSFVCITASTINMLIIGRFIQGTGAGACASLWRSIFRDVFKGEELARHGSYLVIFIMFIVPSSPLLGGYLQTLFGWHANFMFMGVYSIVALLGIIIGFKETSQNHGLSKLNRFYIFNTYKRLITSKLFMSITFSTFLSYGAFFAWFTTGPVLLIDKLDVSPEDFGWITFLGGGAAYALAGWINGRAVKHFGMANMMRFGWSIMILSGFLMLTGKYSVGLEIWTIVVPVVLFYFGATFIWPNAFAIAFTPFGDIAGYAGAFYGFMQIGGAAIIAGIISYLPDQDQTAFGLTILISTLLAWAIYEGFSHPGKKESDTLFC